MFFLSQGRALAAITFLKNPNGLRHVLATHIGFWAWLCLGAGWMGASSVQAEPDVSKEVISSNTDGIRRAAEATSGTIYEIRVEGAQRVEKEAVFLHIRSAVGGPPNRKVLQGDVRRILHLSS